MNTKILGLSGSDADIAKQLDEATILIDGIAKDFFAVGKRKEICTQDVIARLMLDTVNGPDWTALGKPAQALFLHRHANASAARQIYEKKGYVVKRADDWE